MSRVYEGSSSNEYRNFESSNNNNITRGKDINSLNFEFNVLRQHVTDLQTQMVDLKKQRDALNIQIETIESEHREAQLKLNELGASRNGANEKLNWNSESFDHSSKLRTILNETFGFQSFRPMQLAVMNATLCGNDVFVVMPTGAGKSLLYQIPALADAPKLTVVISPLLSLSRDQVLGLRQRKGFINAAMLSSETSKQDSFRIRDSVRNGTLHLLYITPEKVVSSKKLISLLEELYDRDLLARFVIDEAHCCSTMGHDFRPDYLQLHILKSKFPSVPLLAVTATATISVQNHVCKQLLGNIDHYRDLWTIFRTSFNRTNLEYRVLEKPAKKSKGGKTELHMQQLADLIKHDFPGKCGIVYCFSQKHTEETATFLSNNGISAAAYHGNMTPGEKERSHTSWINDRTHVMCATSAFGMGIDKPNVRFVIHQSMPTSMESYCQESGRAGRDQQKAVCILQYSRADVIRTSTLLSNVAQGHKKILDILKYCENQTLCRREIMSQSFGEKYQQSMCNNMCDICQRLAPPTTTRDATEESKKIVRIVSNLKRSEHMPMSQLVKTFRSQCDSKQWTEPLAEKLIMELLVLQVLELYWKTTKYRSNTYLKSGARSYEVTSKGLAVQLNVSQPSKAATKTPKKTSSKKAKDKTTSIVSPSANKDAFTPSDTFEYANDHYCNSPSRYSVSDVSDLSDNDDIILARLGRSVVENSQASVTSNQLQCTPRYTTSSSSELPNEEISKPKFDLNLDSDDDGAENDDEPVTAISVGDVSPLQPEEDLGDQNLPRKRHKSNSSDSAIILIESPKVSRARSILADLSDSESGMESDSDFEVRKT